MSAIETAIEMTTREGGRTRVGPEAVDDLRGALAGPLLASPDPGYDAARTAFNGAFDKRPGLIARCRGTSDVVEAMRFARRYDLLVAVRGGGHSVAGKSSCDGGLLVDLSPTRAVLVDPARRRAEVQGGATWGDVDRETQLHGLAAPGGIVSHTGVAGLTLNGGIGWLRNRFGLACDNLVAAEVVTAVGEVVTASEAERPELLWGLRGGGGNFGVVTRFTFALHPVGPEVAAVFAFYPLEEGEEVVRRWRDWAEAAPAEVTSEVVLWTAPDVEGLPPGARGRRVAVPGAVYAGPPEEGERVLAPLLELGERLGEIAGTMPFRGVQQAFDPFFPNTGEIRGYWKSLHVPALSDEAIALLLHAAAERTSEESMVVAEHVGAAVREVPPEATAFAARDAAYIVNFMATWREPTEGREHVGWAREVWDGLVPHSTGAPYLNFLGEEGGGSGELVRRAFGPNYDRLVALKRGVDPDNVFRLNQNVAP